MELVSAAHSQPQHVRPGQETKRKGKQHIVFRTKQSEIITMLDAWIFIEYNITYSDFANKTEQDPIAPDTTA
jgi:hypothetical protein